MCQNCYEHNLSTRVPICVEPLEEPVMDDELVLDEDMGLDEPLDPPSTDKSNKRKSDEGPSK